MHLVMGFSFPLEQILTEVTSEPLSGGTSQSQLRPSEQHTKQLLWAAKCILECQRCDAHSPGGNSSPPYWGKLSSVTACWTWRTARWSLHKVGVLAFLEHTAPYGSADVQSSWEVAEDNTVVLRAWQRQEFCIHLCLHSGSPLPSGAKLNKQLRCITGPPNPFKKCKAEHPPTPPTPILLPLMNSLFHILCWESFHLEVHPTALPEREDSCEITVRSQKYLQMFKYLSVHQKLADSCQLQILLASYCCNRDSCQLVWQRPPGPHCSW